MKDIEHDLPLLWGQSPRRSPLGKKDLFSRLAGFRAILARIQKPVQSSPTDTEGFRDISRCFVLDQVGNALSQSLVFQSSVI